MITSDMQRQYQLLKESGLYGGIFGSALGKTPYSDESFNAAFHGAKLTPQDIFALTGGEDRGVTQGEWDRLSPEIQQAILNDPATFIRGQFGKTYDNMTTQNNQNMTGAGFMYADGTPIVGSAIDMFGRISSEGSNLFNSEDGKYYSMRNGESVEAVKNPNYLSKTYAQEQLANDLLTKAGLNPDQWMSYTGNGGGSGDLLSVGAEGGIQNYNNLKWVPGVGLVHPRSDYMQVTDQDANIAPMIMLALAGMVAGPAIAGAAGGTAGAGTYATVGDAIAAGDFAAADAMGAAAFDAGGGISGMGSSFGAAGSSGAGGLIEGVNAYSYGGQLVPYGDVVSNAAPGFSMTTGGYTPSMWDTIKTGASSLFGGGGGGNGAGTAAGVAANAAGGAAGGGINWGGLLATGAGALLGGVNGSKQTGEQTQSQAPWAPMQPYLLAAGQQAANVYDQARTMPQGTQNALNSAQGVINQQLGSPLYNQSQNVASGLLSGQMQGVSIPQTFSGMGALDPTAAYQSQLSGQVNPYVDQMAQSITNQVNRNTLENVMPSIRSGAQAAGQYGSSRQGIAEGLAASRAQQDLGSSLSNLYGSAYENAQGRQASAANQLGSMGVNNAQNNNTQRLAQFNTGANLWNQGNNTQNTAVQNALGVANYPNQYQWDQLKNYSGIVNPMAGMGGTTSTPTYTNPWANALGGAITGAQTYKTIFG